MSILKKVMICMLALACMPFAGCTNGSSSTSSGTVFDVERVTEQTFTYQGVDYLADALLYEGEKYLSINMRTVLSSYRVSDKLGECLGRSYYSYYVYTIAEDTQQCLLYEMYNRDGGLVEGSNPTDFKENFRGVYLKEGTELPNIFESPLSHVQVTKETVAGRVIQVETLLDVDFETPLCLNDILSADEPVTEIDTRLDMYAVFDLVDYSWLQLGELALYEKDGDLYLRPHAWTEEYYRLNDECQQLYKAMQG
jgi:hypothetical protein